MKSWLQLVVGILSGAIVAVFRLAFFVRNIESLPIVIKALVQLFENIKYQLVLGFYMFNQ